MVNSVIVNNTLELRTAIINSKEGDIIQIKAGDYERINLDNKKQLTLQAYDSEEKPNITRINIYASQQIKLIDLVIGNNVFDIENNTAIGINASLSNDLQLIDLEIKNARDAIGIRNSSNISIKDSYIHDIERDGIIMLNVKHIDIQHNIISNFHPNYEQYDYDNWFFDENGTAFLPKLEGEENYIPADHADFIQLANSSDITIQENTLDAANGAWTQSIFIHDGHHNAPVVIKDNLIKNGHQIGIKVINQDTVEQSGNELLQVDSLGIKKTLEHFPQIDIAEYDHNDFWIVHDGVRELINTKDNGKVVPPILATEVIKEVAEGNIGIMPNYFLLAMNHPLPDDITLHYETRDGTAIAGEDYIATSGTVTILAGETHIAIAVDILGDTTYESDETFSLVITDPQGEAQFPINTTEIIATHTIINEDNQTLKLSGIDTTEEMYYF